MTEIEREDRLALADDERMLRLEEALLTVVQERDAYAREIAALRGMREALTAFAIHACYPVAKAINPRGYAWRNEEALDYAKQLADAALSAPHPQARKWPDCECARLWECMGRKQSLPEPGECNWPDCGCDPYATKVVASLIEQGWTPRPDPQFAADARPSEATAGREAIASAFAKQFPAVLAQYSQFKIVDWFLALHASRNGVDIDGPNTKPQFPVGHYTGRPIT